MSEPKSHGPECAVYARVVCKLCGHHNHSHDRAKPFPCRWPGCKCIGFVAINPDAKFIVRA